jgi:adenosine deaminase
MGLPDIHLHLDGSLRPDTLAHFAKEDGVSVPRDILFEPGMGLTRALSCFGFTLDRLTLPSRVERVAHEICEDAAADGVTSLEIRFAPQLHGGPPADFIDAALAGVSGQAGVILCGLYGEPPEVLENLVELARSRPGVVAIDLAGGPVPGHDFGMQAYAPAFARAAELGLGRTVHAGEGRPPEEIRCAIETLQAQRIGHGTTILEDPSVVDLVLERGIVLEACPTSNLHTGAISALDEHPLGTWLRLGIKACVNTDNTLLSDVCCSEEHRRAGAGRGMTPALLELAISHGHAAVFPQR